MLLSQKPTINHLQICLILDDLMSHALARHSSKQYDAECVVGFCARLKHAKTIIMSLMHLVNQPSPRDSAGFTGFVLATLPLASAVNVERDYPDKDIAC